MRSNANVVRLWERHRVQSLKKLLKILMLILPAMCLIRYASGETVQLISDGFILALLLLSCFLLCGRDRYLAAARLALAAGYIGLLYTLVGQVESPIRYVWFPIGILLSYFFLGKKEAFQWMMLLIFVLIGLQWYGEAMTGLNRVNFGVWLVTIYFVYLTASEYEKIVDEAIDRLLHVQYDLRDQVEVQTRDLKQLNAELELRVAREVSKNFDNNQLMMQQARMAQMGKMLAMIAHQWRQPLAAVNAAVHLLLLKQQRDDLDAPLLKQKLEAVAGYVQHLSLTIDDFRYFFKADQTKRPERIDAVIRSALTIVDASLQDEGIAVEKAYDTDLCLSILPRELGQVVLNLIKNAEDALRERKTEDPYIRISSGRQEGWIVLSVGDNAGGIDPGDISYIFDADFTTKAASGGSGLGLYMSRLIIEEHFQGKLDVRNTETGAEFRIMLPPQSIVSTVI
jgi:signal transduction histidine kinase